MDRDELVRRADEGERFDFLFFWGHRQKRAGAVDASCLSQWFPAPFVVDGATYPTAEHFMMAGKATLFGDGDARDAILATTDPRKAKALGRKVRDFDEARWATRRLALVVEGNAAKFSQRAPLRAFLLGTGTRVLVEASPRDRTWGIGLSQHNPRALDPRTWRGANLLGFALMEARKRIG